VTGGGQLRQGQVDQFDQVLAAAGGGVARSQQAGQRLPGRSPAVQVGQQRMKPERLLVGARRALLGVAVRGYQGRVRVHDQHLDRWIATGRPHPGAGMRPGGPQPGQPIGVVGDPLDDPPGGRGRGHRAEQLRLVAQHRQVAQAIATIGQHHRQIAQHGRVRVTTGARLVPAQRHGQPEPVGQLPQQRRASMADHTGAVGGDYEAGRRVGSLHPQGALPEPGLRPSDSRILPAQRAPCVISITRDRHHKKPRRAALPAQGGQTPRVSRPFETPRPFGIDGNTDGEW
jgi:hypothetical protein